MLLLEQNISQKEQSNKIMSKPKFKDNINKKYKIRIVYNSAVYPKKLKSGFFRN